MKQVKGFTLIELIAVIVILSILAVTAVPQFLDLRTDARNAVSAGVGGAIASGTAMNFAKGLAAGTAGVATVVTSCIQATNGSGARIATLVPGATGASDSTFTLNGTTYTLAAVGADGTALLSATTRQCTVAQPGASAQTFTITGCASTTCS